MIYICYFLLGLLVLRILIALANYLSFAYLPEAGTLVNEPTVSILIPARNEEKHIGALLEQLASLEYSSLEIIVYNDYSDDETEGVVKKWATHASNIKLINKQPLPQGWLGKNYACHRLARAANGEVLLFLDADVRVKKGFVKRSIYHFQKCELHLLSVFPKQILGSFGEKISVPLMNWILLSLLPLPLIRKSTSKAFSAANGQFMMFRSDTYKTLWPHEKCKSDRVEDIAILRLFKQKGLKSDALLGDEDVSCRMYDGLDAAITGFTKNIFQFFGNSKSITIAFGLITTIAPFILYMKMGIGWSMAYMVGILSIRLFVSLASRQSIAQNLMLVIPQHIVFLIIISKGLITNKKRKLLWKGRNILQE